MKASTSLVASALLFQLFGFAALGLSQIRGNVTATKRHVVVLQGGIDSIWGTYLFAVDNRSKTPEAAEFPLMLPKEKIDFQAQEGLKPEELRLGEGANEGTIYVNKLFPPGSTLIGVNFKAAAKFGKTKLSFTVPFPMDEFLVMVPEGDVNISSPGVQARAAQAFAGQRYHMVQFENPGIGKSFDIYFEGIPEGRNRFWTVGIIAGLCLFLAGAAFAWLTRPRGLEENEFSIS